jgi:glycine hydroxymethyltransferase
VSLVARGITGKDADATLGRSHITVNKNTVPNDPQSPFVTSGIRIGTSAVTTRGMCEPEMETIAGLIDQVLRATDDTGVAEEVKGKVRELTRRFPLYA